VHPSDVAQRSSSARSGHGAMLIRSQILNQVSNAKGFHHQILIVGALFKYADWIFNIVLDLEFQI
jgi:hypothetical protein